MSEYDIADIANKALFLGVSSVVLLVPALLLIGFIYLWFGIGSSVVKFESDSLNLDAVFYGRSIELAEIQENAVVMADFSNKSQAPSVRTNGISIFGLNWGWFRSAQGRKQLLFVTDASKAVYIPTSLDFDVIVSAKEPEQLIRAIQESK